MKLVKNGEYKGRKIEVWQVDVDQPKLDNPVWKVDVDSSCISDENSIPGPTLDLVWDDAEKWIDQHPVQS